MGRVLVLTGCCGYDIQSWGNRVHEGALFAPESVFFSTWKQKRKEDRNLSSKTNQNFRRRKLGDKTTRSVCFHNIYDVEHATGFAAVPRLHIPTTFASPPRPWHLYKYATLSGAIVISY